MTSDTTPTDTTFADLARMHSLLCDAHHNLHLAWMGRTTTTDDLDPNLSAAIDMVYAMQDRIYTALRRHPQHPLNAELDVPLADDTAPALDMPVHSKLSDYRAWIDHNTQVKPGDTIFTTKGEAWTFDRVSKAPGLGSSGKVQVHNDHGIMEFYPQVFNLIIT